MKKIIVAAAIAAFSLSASASYRDAQAKQSYCKGMGDLAGALYDDKKRGVSSEATLGRMQSKGLTSGRYGRIYMNNYRLVYESEVEMDRVETQSMAWAYCMDAV